MSDLKKKIAENYKPDLKKRLIDKQKDKELDKKLREIGVGSGTPTTVQEALKMGWKQSPIMMPSNPPVFIFEKDGKTIRIRGKGEPLNPKGFKKRFKRPDNKFKNVGGSVSKYSKGGGVRAAKYKV